MKKGFTLIELLGVIVILTILTLIITPLATGIINRSTNELNDIQINNIKSSTIAWVSEADNLAKLPDKDSNYKVYQISLQEDLINGGYAKKELLDIKSKEVFQDVYVAIIYDNNQYVYDIYKGNKILLLDTNRRDDLKSVLVLGKDNFTQGSAKPNANSFTYVSYLGTTPNNNPPVNYISDDINMNEAGIYHMIIDVDGMKVRKKIIVN